MTAVSLRTAVGAAALLAFSAGEVNAAQPPAPTPARAVLDPGLPSYRAEGEVSGSALAVTGMDSVEGMFHAWADAFRALHPGARLAIEQRDLAPEERIGLGPEVAEIFNPSDRPYEDRYGYDPFRIAVCQAAFSLKSHVSAIGVFVGKANPIDEIALDKLDAMFSDERRRGYPTDIRRWGQLGLGGAWADKPIHLYGFYWRDDVTAYFRQLVDRDAPFKAAYRVPAGDMARRTPAVAADLMRTLEQDPYGIGFANFSYATPGVKALALIDEHGVRAEPGSADIAAGRYPLQRYIYIYVHRAPGRPIDPMLKAFLTFILSREGQALVAKDHYLPLTSAMAAAERAKLD